VKGAASKWQSRTATSTGCVRGPGSAVAVVGLQVFAVGISAVGLVALLGSSSNQPLSLLQLAFLTSSKFGAGAVTGLIILALTVLAALAARIVGLRVGLARNNSAE